MSVAPFQNISAAVVNAAFISRLTDSSTVAKIDLQNADLVSGGSVFNIQRAFNGLSSYAGSNPNGDFDQIPAWSSNAIGSPTDNLFQRIEALQSFSEGINPSSWNVVEIDFSQFAVASLNTTITALVIGEKTILNGIVFKVQQEFFGGSISAITASVGIAGESDRYVETFDLFAVPTGTDFEIVLSSDLFSFDSPQNIEILVEATGDNLDQLTQGMIEFYYLTSQLPTP